MTARPLSLTTEPIPRLTWRIASPAYVGLLFQTLQQVADTYAAGLLGTDALAALSRSFPLFFALLAIGGGLSQGATALLAHALGAGQVAEARRLLAQALLLGAGVALVVALGGQVFARTILSQLGATGRDLDLVVAYAQCLLGGSLFFVLLLTLNSALAAQGETRVYRNFLLAAFGAKCALNPLLIWGWGPLPALGLPGVALGSVLIQAGGCLLLWRAVRRTKLGELSADLFRPDAHRLRRIAGQALPAFANLETIALGLFVITWFAQQFGKEAVVAFGIAARLEYLVLLPILGLGTAVLGLVGQNHGARQPERVRVAWWFNVRVGLALTAVGGPLLVLLAEPALRIFTDDAQVVAHGQAFLRVAAFTLPAYPILFMTTFLMSGLQCPAYGLWVGLYRQIVAPIALISWFAFTLGGGLDGVWWGICAATWSAALFALWWGWRTVRRLGANG